MPEPPRPCAEDQKTKKNTLYRPKKSRSAALGVRLACSGGRNCRLLRGPPDLASENETFQRLLYPCNVQGIRLRNQRTILPAPGQAFGDDSPATVSNCERRTRSRWAV